MVLATLVSGALLEGGCARREPRVVLSSAAGEPITSRVLVNVDENGLALQGYDPVAYFMQGRPVQGDSGNRLAFKGAIYQFANAEHKRLFEADPSKYEPQFGGFCGYAASINKVSPVSVDYWEIIDGRLVLQHNQKAWDLWHKDVSGNLDKADYNWPDLVESWGR